MLTPEFKGNVTPVLVTREVDWVETSTNDKLADELESRVAEWANSKASGDLFRFLSLYADDFTRWGMDKAEWSSIQLRAARQRVIRAVFLDDLLLLAYPSEEGLFLSRFRQKVEDDEQVIVSTTRLYWRRDSSGALKIIAEDEG